MKIAIITDTHFGVRNDSPGFLENVVTFLRKDFFPRLKREGIKHVLHLGDLMDRRKYVNFKTSKAMRDEFLAPILDAGMSLDVIAGNHDEFYKNTHEVNSLEELIGGRNDRITHKATPVDGVLPDGTPALFLPWITDSNRAESMQLIGSSKASLCFGHLELSGFEYSRGIMAHEDAMSPSLFKKFDMTMSGHYHHRSSKGGIHYLGSPSEHTWSDYKDPRGFHIFTTETRDLLFVENKNTMFLKMHYDDREKGFDPRDFVASHDITGRVVKLVVHSRENPYWLDTVIDLIEEQGPEDLSVVEDHLNLDEVSFDENGMLSKDGDVLANPGSNLALLRRLSAELAKARNVSEEKLDRLMVELYNDALALE